MFSSSTRVKSRCGFPKWTERLFQLSLLALPGLHTAFAADDFAARLDARSAIERVYHNHRLGTKPPFEETLPRATLESLVRVDSNKEATLKKIYGATITPAQLAAEVQRINTTTRAPEILADIKAALDNDPGKFANLFAKPILVERELRQRFDNDDALHAPQRREMEKVRGQLLKTRSRWGEEAHSDSELGTRNSERERGLQSASPAAGERPSKFADTSSTRTFKRTEVRAPLAQYSRATNGLVEELTAFLKSSPFGSFSEAAWQLGARPEEKPATPTADEIEIKKRFGANAQIISSPNAGLGKEQKFYFEDLPGELQKVLRAQLRQPGDVSAVIETPGGFLLYLAKEKTGAVLSVASLSIPKRSYEQWLEEQNEGTK